MMSLRKAFPIFERSPWLAAFLSLSVTTFILTVSFFVFTYLLPQTEVVTAKELGWAPPVDKPIMAVNIANDGTVFLRGASVLSVDGTTIIVGTSWNVTKFQWVINTNESYYEKSHFGTRFLDSKGKVITIWDIHPGSIISVSGTLDVNQSWPTLKAKVIRTTD